MHMSTVEKNVKKHDIQLECPECGGQVRVGLAELGLGRRARCGHCGVESYLNHYRESVDNPPRWRLESTLPDPETGRGG